MKFETVIKEDGAYIIIHETIDTARIIPVMTKEGFRECYERWICNGKTNNNRTAEKRDT